MALLDDLSTLTPEQLDQVYLRLAGTPDSAAAILIALQTEIRERCARDGAYWLRFVRTRDEADAEHSVKPFPVHLDYLRVLWDVLVQSNRVVVAKSRQMLVSWAVAAFCCWWARFKPHQAVYWQSQKDADANAMIALPGTTMGRCQFIEAGMPDFLRLPVKPAEGRLLYPNGSFLQAVAGGANQIRGRVFSLYVGDEFAHQEEATGVYTAVSPLMQKGAKAIFVSTPNGSDNQFAKLYFGT